MERKFQICAKTVMDTIGDPDILFDKDGVCNYYHEYVSKLKYRVPKREDAERQLDTIVKKIKRDGLNKKYDCVIGVSGGVDSTYTAWLVKQLGLNPIAVHLDNGWNSELAVSNIENVLKKLEIELYTKVLDWEMFKDLQMSFLKASTPDGEIPTDHAIYSTMYQVANKYGIKYIITGMNFRNEGMLPPSWARGYLDWKYIKSVHRKFGKSKLKGYPHLNVFNFLYLNIFKGIKNLSLINYVQFNKLEAIKVIEKELEWRNYGGKHYESIYTRFFQAYILPRKFKIDKRKAHLTCLIASTGEISREEALEALKAPICDEDLLVKDKLYVQKKFNLTDDQFEEIMQLPVKSIFDYPNNHSLELKFRKMLNRLRSYGILPN
jgi:N-acetyl sugar amidotransferase